MKITKFEQSGFICETQNGTRIAIDIATLTPLEKLGAVPPIDVFLVSHIHGDHFSLDHIKKLAPKRVLLNSECVSAIAEEFLDSFETVQIASGEVIDLGGDVTVECFTSDHGPNVTKPVENLGFIIRADGKSLYFAGDMFNPSGLDTKTLEMDYVLLPVGGFYTFGVAEAFALAQTFKSIGKIIPMHYEMKPEAGKEFSEMAEELFHVEVMEVVK